MSTSGQTTSGQTTSGQTTSPPRATKNEGGGSTTVQPETSGDVAAFLADLAAPGGEPIDLVPTLDESAVTTEIGREGGSVTATGSDGTTYLLELPANALLFPTDITLTPLADVTGFPFDSPPQHRVGVDLAPRGLELGRQATLTITPAVSPEGMAVAALGYPGDGHNAGAEPFSEEEGSILLTLEHFSGYVVIYPVDVSQLRAIARAKLEMAVWRFEAELAVFLAFLRLQQTYGIRTPDPVTVARNRLPDYRKEILIPYLNNAALGCQEGMDAVAAWFAYWRQAQVLGVAGDDDSPGDPEFFVELSGETLRNSFELPERLLPTIVDHCLEEDYRACVVTGDLGILYSRILSFERTMQLLGRSLEPAWVDLLVDYAKRCGQWRLTVHTEFERTMQIDSAHRAVGTGAITRDIEMRWQPGAGVGLDRVADAKIEGEAELELNRILFRWTGESCPVTDSQPTPQSKARARIAALKYEYDELSPGITVRQGRPVALTVAVELGSMFMTHQAMCENPWWPVTDFFDEFEVSHVMFETGAVQKPDPDVDMGPFAMLITRGWEFVGSPFRARFFNEGTSQTLLAAVPQLQTFVFAQLDILLTHTPK